MADATSPVETLRDATPAYCELFTHFDDENPTEAFFTCSICKRSVDDGPCPEHAPVQVPGLRLAECDASPKHWVFVHDRDDYGADCPYCRLAEHAERERLARQCRHWGWRRWKVAHKFTGWLYVVGISSSGGGWMHGDGHDGCLPDRSLRFRGKRQYFLGVSRTTWYCWRRGHRRGEPVGFGFCGKCVPWPCCGSIREEHNDDCPENPPVTFDASVPPGGFVCAVPDDKYLDGICGMPVETEPCPEHAPKRAVAEIAEGGR